MTLYEKAQEWAEHSRKKEVCGILLCEKLPLVLKCAHCGCWYCEEHKFVLNDMAHPGYADS